MDRKYVDEAYHLWQYFVKIMNKFNTHQRETNNTYVCRIIQLEYDTHGRYLRRHMLYRRYLEMDQESGENDFRVV